MSSDKTPLAAVPVPARPEFMAVLGLLPPYTAEDVEKSYLTRLKEIRPDLGGDREAFYAVQAAYGQAKEYVRFRGDRRGWIARQMDDYLATQTVAERLTGFGAAVEFQSLDWLQKSFGDFAQLTESIVGVRLHNAANGDEVLNYLISQQAHLPMLRHIDLAGSTVSDASVCQLVVFRHLAELDLSRTPISRQALLMVRLLPELETVRVDGIALGWLTRHRLDAQLRQNRRTAATARTVHPTNVR